LVKGVFYMRIGVPLDKRQGGMCLLQNLVG
jgi:hypothetical protein